MTTSNRGSGRTPQRAFTLVELLVVMGVIALLVMIMLPSVVAVKNAAKATATKALLHSISSGLDMYRSESRLGREYPPSFWKAIGPANPFRNKNDFVAYGAQTLPWALGALGSGDPKAPESSDMLGTPGFGDTMSPDDPSGLYRVVSGNSTQARFGPFIDLSKISLNRPEGLGLTLRPWKTYDADGQVWVILDKFDMPILYFRAEPDQASFYPAPSVKRLYRYNVEHNLGFLRPGVDPIADQTDSYARFYLGYPARTPPEYGYILDTRSLGTSAIYLPHNGDSYLLISPGPDMVYGTRDDVTNFPHNAQQLP